MAQVSLEVPATLVDAVRESLILLYRATTEALHSALRAHDERRGSLEEVEQHRSRLAQLDATIDLIGWSQGSVARDGGLVLRAPRDVLHDALYGALIDAGERLAVACGASWRSEAGRESVRAVASEVIALDRLLRRVG